MHPTRVSTLTLFALTVLPFRGQGQVCPDCRVESYDIMPLAIPESIGGAAGPPLTARLDSKGRIWVLHQDDLPMYFTRDGRFGGRLGTPGPGPAEFIGPTGIFAAGSDSIGVIDPSTARISIWSGELHLGRTISMRSPVARAHVLDWPSRLLAGATVLTPEAAGWPLHIIDLSGTDVVVRQSFGAEGGELIRGPIGAVILERRIWREETEWWIANSTEPAVRRWSLNPPQVLEERRASPPRWFDDPVRKLQFGRELPARIDGIWYDGTDDLVWLFAREPDNEKFTRALEAVRAGGGSEVAAEDVPTGADVYRTHAIVLDAEGRIVVDSILGGLVVDVLSDGRVILASPDDLGLSDISARRYRLVR